MKVYYEKDANMGIIKNKNIAVVGYGSQGYGHSNNLKDSLCNVAVALRKESPSWQKAEKAGLKVMTVSEAAAWADIIMILTPDELQGIFIKMKLHQT